MALSEIGLLFLSGNMDGLSFLNPNVECLVLANDLWADHLIAGVRPSRAFFSFDKVICNILDSDFFNILDLERKTTLKNFPSQLVMNLKWEWEENLFCFKQILGMLVTAAQSSLFCLRQWIYALQLHEIILSILLLGIQVQLEKYCFTATSLVLLYTRCSNNCSQKRLYSFVNSLNVVFPGVRRIYIFCFSI